MVTPVPVLPSVAFVPPTGAPPSTRPLRIGIFAPYDLARDGGVATHLRAQARALRNLGHEVSVYGPASSALNGGEIALSGSTVVTISGTASGLGLDPRSGGRVARLFASTPFDVLHVHEPLTPILPWFVLKHARAPIVGTFHVHREGGHSLYPIARPWLRPLMRRVDYRIAVSESARRTVAQHFPGEYDIVPNGLDVDAFSAPRPRPAAMAMGRRHVLYVGRLEPRKGVGHLIRAVASVQRSVADARLIVVGDGPDRGALNDLARSVGADVIFAGRVDDQELPAYYQASDVVCSPSLRGESFGIVLLEAMACGKPIVASRIAGYEALVGNAGGGPLVPPGDADAIADALVSLLGDEALRREFGGRGSAAVRAYDWSAIAGRLDAIYRRVLERCPTHVRHVSDTLRRRPSAET
jgi:phosphatidylinositol alpha-mannosyltransferase